MDTARIVLDPAYVNVNYHNGDRKFFFNAQSDTKNEGQFNLFSKDEKTIDNSNIYTVVSPTSVQVSGQTFDFKSMTQTVPGADANAAASTYSFAAKAPARITLDPAYVNVNYWNGDRKFFLNTQSDTKNEGQFNLFSKDEKSIESSTVYTVISPSAVQVSGQTFDFVAHTQTIPAANASNAPMVLSFSKQCGKVIRLNPAYVNVNYWNGTSKFFLDSQIAGKDSGEFHVFSADKKSVDNSQVYTVVSPAVVKVSGQTFDFSKMTQSIPAADEAGAATVLAISKS